MPIVCCASASLPRESFSCCNCLLRSCLEGKRANRTANTSIILYHVYKYFKKGSAKSKYRGPQKLTSKTAEVTGYSERTVRRIVVEKSEISGAAFTSPPKQCKIKEEHNTG